MKSTELLGLLREAFPEVDFDAYPDGIPDAPGLQLAASSDAHARELVRRLRGS